MFELEHGFVVVAWEQPQLDLAGGTLSVDRRQKAGRFAAQDLATCVALELELSTDRQIAGDREEEALQAIRASHTSISRRGPGSTVYRRRVPMAKTVANPLSRSTRRCGTGRGEPAIAHVPALPNSR